MFIPQEISRLILRLGPWTLPDKFVNIFFFSFETRFTTIGITHHFKIICQYPPFKYDILNQDQELIIS